MSTLDTNVLIYHSSGDPKVSSFIFDQLKRGARLLVPTVVVVEYLCYPAIRPSEEHVLNKLVPNLRIVDLDIEIARHAAALRRRFLLKLGDAIVAATALFTGTTLVTRNIRDFKKVPGLKLLKI